MYIQQQENSVFIGIDDKIHSQQTPVLEKNTITKKKKKTLLTP